MDADAKVRAAAEPLFDKANESFNAIEEGTERQLQALTDMLVVLRALNPHKARELIHRIAQYHFDIGNRIASLDQQ